MLIKIAIELGLPLFELEQWHEFYLQKYIKYFSKNGFNSDRIEMYLAQIAYFSNKNEKTKITDYLIRMNAPAAADDSDIFRQPENGKKHPRTLGFNVRLPRLSDKKINRRTPKAPPIAETRAKMAALYGEKSTAENAIKK